MATATELVLRQRTIQENDPRFQIAAARRMLQREGVDSQIGGHVSLRVPGEDSFYVTPFQYFDESLPDHVMKIGFDMNVMQPGTLPASPGINFHSSLYMARPDINCVIHTHGRNCALVGALGKPLGMYHVYSSIFFNDIAVFKDDLRMTPDQEGEAIARCLGSRRALLMEHHGAIHVGPSLEVTTVDAILLEYCAGIQITAMQIGSAELDEETSHAYRAAYLKNTFHKHMWDANYRRLRRSDAELFKVLDAG